jgi:hypothetical protein
VHAPLGEQLDRLYEARLEVRKAAPELGSRGANRAGERKDCGRTPVAGSTNLTTRG